MNVRAPFILMQEAARLMRHGRGGSIVNIITMASHGGEPDIGWTAAEGEHAVQTGTGEPEDWPASADSGAAGQHVAPAPAGASA